MVKKKAKTKKKSVIKKDDSKKMASAKDVLQHLMRVQSILGIEISNDVEHLRKLPPMYGVITTLLRLEEEHEEGCDSNFFEGTESSILICASMILQNLKLSDKQIIKAIQKIQGERN